MDGATLLYTGQGKGLMSTHRFRFILASLLVSVSFISAACGEDHEQVALDVAEGWSVDALDSAAAEIGAAVTGNIPVLSGLAGGVVREQLEEGISWSFSTPAKAGDTRYTVRATASSSVTISIPILADQVYEVRAPFNLEIDTDAGKVSRWTIDLPSLSVSRR